MLMCGGCQCRCGRCYAGVTVTSLPYLAARQASITPLSPTSVNGLSVTVPSLAHSQPNGYWQIFMESGQNIQRLAQFFQDFSFLSNCRSASLRCGLVFLKSTFLNNQFKGFKAVHHIGFSAFLFLFPERWLYRLVRECSGRCSSLLEFTFPQVYQQSRDL